MMGDSMKKVRKKMMGLEMEVLIMWVRMKVKDLMKVHIRHSSLLHVQLITREERVIGK